MARSRRNRDCGSENFRNNEDFGSNDNFIDPINSSRNRNSSRGRSLFPTDIKRLLILIAEDDDERNRATLILDACANHCLIEDARIIAVMDNTVVVRDCNKFRFVCIGCICEVIVNCDVILDELLEQHSFNRE